MVRSRVTCGLVALTALLWMGAATAQGEESDNTGFYIAPMASYSFFGEDTFDPDGTWGGQLSFGNRLSDYLAVELFGSYYSDASLDNRFGSEANLDSTSYGVGALIFPVPDLFPIYALVAGGVGEYDFDQRTAGPANLNVQESEFVDVGVGVLVPITDGGIALRAEYRYRSSEVDAGNGQNYRFRNNIVSIGVQIPLTSDAQPTRVVTQEPAPTPAMEPSDADGDGVINSWDRCPNTPSNTPVTSNGCPAETASKDDGEPIILKGVTFAFDSYALTAQAEDRLQTSVNALKAEPEVDVLVAGHTDSIGSASYNLELSQLRAQSVAEFLKEHGIDGDRLKTMGFGETMPIAPNSTAAGRAKNRRVEFEIMSR